MNDRRIRIIIFAAVFAVVAVAYLSSVAPTASFWDCGELIAASCIMGIPHPPGTPFFVTLGRLFSLIPFSREMAYRTNMIPVLFGAFSCGLIYLLIIKLISPQMTLRPMDSHYKRAMAPSLALLTVAALTPPEHFPSLSLSQAASDRHGGAPAGSRPMPQYRRNSAAGPCAGSGSRCAAPEESQGGHGQDQSRPGSSVVGTRPTPAGRAGSRSAHQAYFPGTSGPSSADGPEGGAAAGDVGLGPARR